MGQHPQCGSSQRHEPGCGGSAEGQAQPRGAGLPQWPWAEAGGDKGQGGTPKAAIPRHYHHPQRGGMRDPRAWVGREGPDPAWRCAGATRGRPTAGIRRSRRFQSHAKDGGGFGLARRPPHPPHPRGPVSPSHRGGGVPQVRTAPRLWGGFPSFWAAWLSTAGLRGGSSGLSGCFTVG